MDYIRDKYDYKYYLPTIWNTPITYTDKIGRPRCGGPSLPKVYSHISQHNGQMTLWVYLSAHYRHVIGHRRVTIPC